ncbi:MAG: sortase B protein-sorting domain-containing protein [Eubacteriales bacterium]|nr:sortase B protein-sorting domain-containing protein [Eubacteriales bacterium]
MSFRLKKNCIRFCGLMLILLLTVSLLSAFAVSAEAAYSASVDVKQVFKLYRSSGTSVSDVFTYQVTALNGAPTGNERSFTLTGNETKTLTFSFTEPGDYEYQVKLVLSSRGQYYTYDEAVYRIRIYNKSDETIVIIYDSNGNKISSITYQHSYTAPEVDPAHPQTGDDSGITWYVFLLLASAAVLGILRKKQKMIFSSNR